MPLRVQEGWASRRKVGSKTSRSGTGQSRRNCKRSAEDIELWQDTVSSSTRPVPQQSGRSRERERERERERCPLKILAFLTVCCSEQIPSIRSSFLLKFTCTCSYIYPNPYVTQLVQLLSIPSAEITPTTAASEEEPHRD